jgi:hypothetical protein
VTVEIFHDLSRNDSATSSSPPGKTFAVINMSEAGERLVRCYKEAHGGMNYATIYENSVGSRNREHFSWVRRHKKVCAWRGHDVIGQVVDAYR